MTSRSTSAGNSSSTASLMTRTAENRCFSRRHTSATAKRFHIDGHAPILLAQLTFFRRLERHAIDRQQRTDMQAGLAALAGRRKFANRSPGGGHLRPQWRSGITMSPRFTSGCSPPASPAEMIHCGWWPRSELRSLAPAFSRPTPEWTTTTPRPFNPPCWAVHWPTLDGHDAGQPLFQCAASSAMAKTRPTWHGGRLASGRFRVEASDRHGVRRSSRHSFRSYIRLPERCAPARRVVAAIMRSGSGRRGRAASSGEAASAPPLTGDRPSRPKVRFRQSQRDATRRLRAESIRAAVLEAPPWPTWAFNFASRRRDLRGARRWPAIE